ncbi:putative protein MSS51 homolog, mitochondrial isoform X2 [Penaeus japonicus]|uniref:putative protein MSS51 homolog, mitochondrial isoform X2 n=1 Tax=Penaeus japonicus TaxID=27405 RepID=UPI001C70E2C8|nr:putative protein MSS51 homolog, mitochondrial isoform X2 [Penaeus japonicus]XP_042878973.1 putative protein MSS51 homolog, mitochondrial isoform X2 [Penaeus japonicus]
MEAKAGHEKEEQWLPAVRHYHPGICHACFEMPSQKCFLKRCAQCQLVSYCSKQCQKKDWSSHKHFCQANKVDGGKNVFSQAKLKVHDKKSWQEFRNCLQVAANINLQRRLDIFEDEIFLYPRACEVCREANNSLMIDCNRCHSVFYCSDVHRSEDAERHERWCNNYLLCIKCDVVEYKKGVPDLPFPTQVDSEYRKLPRRLVDLLRPQLNTKDVSEDELDPKLIVILSERLSYPLSLLYGMQHLTLGQDRKSVEQLTELKVHVVGAKSTKELLGIIRWEYMVHRLPALMKLHIVFIGPELFSDSGLSEELPDNHCLDDSGMSRCDDCQGKSRAIIYEMCEMLYHDYATTSYFHNPDLIISFNCGFHEFEGEEKDTWPASLSVMLKNPDVPLIFTSYTKTESERDLEVLKKIEDVEVLLPVERNPYSSLRPIRDFTREDDCDMFFVNQYISCVRRKKT